MRSHDQPHVTGLHQFSSRPPFSGPRRASQGASMIIKDRPNWAVIQAATVGIENKKARNFKDLLNTRER